MFSSKISIKAIREHLDFKNVPGWHAQQAMAPPYRQKLVDNSHFNLKTHKVAAILILLYEKAGKLYFPVIHRNTYPGVHSNQIGFPGGKVESFDYSLEQTAIRESYEEIKALPENINILGELTELFIPVSNFIVHPFVAEYTTKPKFIASDLEVKKIIELPLIDFILNPPIRDFKIKTENQYHIVPGFQLTNELPVWGASAMILNEFLELVKNSLNLG